MKILEVFDHGVGGELWMLSGLCVNRSVSCCRSVLVCSDGAPRTADGGGGCPCEGSGTVRGCRQMALSLDGIGFLIPRVQGHWSDQGFSAPAWQRVLVDFRALRRKAGGGLLWSRRPEGDIIQVHATVPGRRMTM